MYKLDNPNKVHTKIAVITFFELFEALTFVRTFWSFSKIPKSSLLTSSSTNISQKSRFDSSSPLVITFPIIGSSIADIAFTTLWKKKGKY